MHTKRELVPLLQAHGLRLSKRLGQHYLVDPNLTRRIVESCAIGPADTVLEIGAGLGALTDLLAQRAERVIAVELDPGIAALLRRRMAAHPNVEVLEQDVLTLAWDAYPRCVVVGNLPYQITSPVLAQLTERAAQVAGAWLGVQRELAQRLSAQPGTKAYGRLTLLVQYRFEVRPIVKMPPQAFFPEPSVDSMWLQLTPRARPAAPVADEARLFVLVRAAFGQRRKTLLNALTHGLALEKSRAQRLIAAAGLPPMVRGEALSLEQFAALANALAAST